ncbi:hypothetical protein CCO02nite_09740 [Cellulomonas composti]|uniref:HTH araC/xylS-type domain-containing protein n=1 Tax=Cellulomonas composti TaxID=266130 RepID=A0A511J8J8_9CELL|nr:hypothetical protein CCO02nite_09740 [Cellulomonas composti]
MARTTAPALEVLLPDGRGLLQLEVATPAMLVDIAPDGVHRPDEDGIRGPAARTNVREERGPSVRAGVQLHPLALARLQVGGVVDSTLPLSSVVGPEDAARARAALLAGDDESAVHLLVAALVARAHPIDEDLEAFGEVIATLDAQRGLLPPPEIARAAEVTVSTLHRWSVRHLGVDLAQYLAAVRFSAFVREAVGPGPVRPSDVVAALRWYAQAGYPPREVERFTGCTPVELRRLEERLAAFVGAPPA